MQVGRTTEYSTTFTDVDGYGFSVNADAGVEFEFIPVDRGFYNTEDDTFFLYRVPARQWLRGISETNTVAQYFHGSDLSSEIVDIHLLHKVFVQGIDVHTAFKKWRNLSQHAVGLSKQFAIAGTTVYFFNKEIGKVKDGCIILDNNIVAQELQDVIRRNGFDMEVSVNVA